MCVTKPPAILLGALYKFHSESQVIKVYYAVTMRMETNRTIFDCIEGMGVLIGVERRKKSPSNCPLKKPGNRFSGSQAKLYSERKTLLIYRRFRIETRKEHGRKVKYRKSYYSTNSEA